MKVCKGLINDGHHAILVTHDVLVSIKAQTMGIIAEEFTTDQVPVSERQYAGRIKVYAPDDLMGKFKKSGISPEHLYTVDANGDPHKVEPVMNQFFIYTPK